MFKWQYGRQNTSYKKWQFLKLPKMDAYFLHIHNGTEIPIHLDLAPNGYEHYRLNIVLKAPNLGGDLHCENCFINRKYLQFFKASSSRHSLSKIEDGEAFYLSIGWLKKTKIKRHNKNATTHQW